MAIKDWNGFKKSGDTYIPNDATARAGVTATVDLMKDTTGWIGGNLCPRFNTETKNSGTLTVDPNTGICSLSGTTSAQTSFFIEQSLKAGTYILDGAPSGSSIGSYDMLASNISIAPPATIARDYAGATTDKKFTLASDTNVRIICRVPQGALDTTKQFKPMILTEEQYKLNPTYRPYHESVELSKYNRSEANILGAKNRMNFPAWKGVATTDANVSWDDDTYTLTLTSTANGGRTNITVPEAAQIDVIPNERIKFVWDSTGSDDSTMGFDIYKVGDVSAPIASASVHDNQLVFTVPENCTKITYRAYSNSANKVIKMANCMCLCGDDTDLTFKKFAMTNRELTESLKYRNVQLTPVPNTGTNYEKVVNVAEQLDALITDVGVKFSGYVLWTQSMFLRVEAMRCNATTLLYTIFNVSNTIYNGAVQNGAVTVYKFEGTQMTS